MVPSPKSVPLSVLIPLIVDKTSPLADIKLEMLDIPFDVPDKMPLAEMNGANVEIPLIVSLNVPLPRMLALTFDVALIIDRIGEDENGIPNSNFPREESVIPSCPVSLNPGAVFKIVCVLSIPASRYPGTELDVPNLPVKEMAGGEGFREEP